MSIVSVKRFCKGCFEDKHLPVSFWPENVKGVECCHPVTEGHRRNNYEIMTMTTMEDLKSLKRNTHHLLLIRERKL